MAMTNEMLVAGSAIVIGRKGNVGAVHLCESGSWPTDTTYYVLPGECFDARFLAHQLRSLQLMQYNSSTAVPSLRRNDLEERDLVMPPVAEQRRIVEILEDHLSRLDAGAQGLSAAARRLRAFTSACAERAKRIVETSAPSSKLSSLALDAGYGTSTKCVVGGLGPAVVRIPNLLGGKVDMTDEKRVADPSVDVSSATLSAGDLLIVRTNGSRQLIGRTAVVQTGIEAAFASYLIRYRLDPTQVRPEWVHLMMQTPSTRAVLESMAASSAGQYNLSLGKLDSLELPAPTLEEQDVLLSESRAMADVADRTTREVELATTRGLAFRRSLLAAAFSGRLT